MTFCLSWRLPSDRVIVFEKGKDTMKVVLLRSLTFVLCFCLMLSGTYATEMEAKEGKEYRLLSYSANGQSYGKEMLALAGMEGGYLHLNEIKQAFFTYQDKLNRL